MDRAQDWTSGLTPADLDLSREVADAMRADLPRVAQQVVDAVRAEVPSYADPFKGEMGRNIENAVTLALGGFLGTRLRRRRGRPVRVVRAGRGRGVRPGPRRGPQRPHDGRPAQRLPRRRPGGLARPQRRRGAGRPARRLGGAASPSWSSPTSTSCPPRAPPGTPTSSPRPGACGSATSNGSPRACCAAARPTRSRPPPSARSGSRPRLLTAVVLPDSAPAACSAQVDAATLQPTEQVPGLEDHPDLTVLLVPERVGPRARRPAARAHRTRGRGRSGAAVAAGARLLRPGAAGRRPRARPRQLAGAGRHRGAPARADPGRRRHARCADLRLQVLAPLDDLRPAVAEKLARDAARLAAAPRPPRRDRRRAVRAPADGALPHAAAARGVRRPARGPGWVLRLTLALA